MVNCNLIMQAGRWGKRQAMGGVTFAGSGEGFGRHFLRDRQRVLQLIACWHIL
jgi:hypothetical protein